MRVTDAELFPDSFPAHPSPPEQFKLSAAVLLVPQGEVWQRGHRSDTPSISCSRERSISPTFWMEEKDRDKTPTPTNLSDDRSLYGSDFAPGPSRFLGSFQTWCFLREWREGFLVGWRIILFFRV